MDLVNTDLRQAITARQVVDGLEAELATLPQANCPLVHRFTPGLYVREIFMPRGTFIISKVHKTEHPYTISKGRVAVWTEAEGVIHLTAPFTGITKPGTRRLLFIQEDCIWTTYHPTTETDLDKIEEAIIDPKPALPLRAETVKALLEVSV